MVHVRAGSVIVFLSLLTQLPVHQKLGASD